MKILNLKSIFLNLSRIGITILFLAVPFVTEVATEFISVVDTDGTSGDYSTLSSWEQYNQTDLINVLKNGRDSF